MKRTFKNQKLYAKLRINSLKEIFKRIKWKNVLILVVGIISAIIILHDLYMITIYSWITGMLYGWTWFGFLTFILAFAIGGEIVEYFYEEYFEEK